MTRDGRAAMVEAPRVGRKLKEVIRRLWDESGPFLCLSVVVTVLAFCYVWSMSGGTFLPP